MNIAVIGTGGVGGYFGSRLTRLQDNDKDVAVYFIARGAYLEEIKMNGLTVDSDEGITVSRPFAATDSIAELPLLDLCIISVKSYDLENVVSELRPKVTDRTIILPLLNGIDIYDRIRPVIKNGIVLPACVYVGTHIESPGIIRQRGGACTIHFGKDPGNDHIDRSIFDILNESGIKYIYHENPYTEIWSKYIFIASYGMVTAAFNKTIGEVLLSDTLSGSVLDIMGEIYSIALKMNIPLPETIINDSFMKGRNFPSETKTSFQRDYEIADKRDERDLFGDTIVRLGKMYDVTAPVTESINILISQGKNLLHR